MRLLVTGGAGFIGSHVANAARSDGHVVAVLDDLSTGRREHLSPGCVFYRADVSNSGEVGRIFREFRPTAVSHHAAQPTVAASVREPLRDAAVNVLGTLNVARLSAVHGVERLVLASSGGTVYGTSLRTCVADRSRTRPLSPYGCSKLAAEHYVRAYTLTHRIRYTILRYANVYGPGQDPAGEGGVVATFVSRLMT